MKPTDTWTCISAERFHKIAANCTVSSKELAELDTFRYESLPDRIATRRKTDGDKVHITKEELLQLVRWKIKHGTFRPTLLSLVSSNDASVVISATSGISLPVTSARVKAVLGQLTKLRGVGPATASLILSVLDPEGSPFFSDEVWRWCNAEEDGEDVTEWKGIMKYNVKEYELVFERVARVRRRIGVEAVEVEKFAYAMEHCFDEKADDEREEEDKIEDRGEAEKESEAPNTKNGKRKRKAVDKEEKQEEQKELSEDVDTKTTSRKRRS